MQQTPHYSKDYKTEILMFNAKEGGAAVAPSQVPVYESKGFEPIGWVNWKD
jgi:hypothetical protein